MSGPDINEAVRMVDNWRERCPGTINQKKLVPIARQKERRRLKRLFRRIKHIIYLQEGTENIWYKNDDCSVGVVKMGFSLKRLAQHPNAVPMEFYYQVFTKPNEPMPVELLRGQSMETLSGLSMSPREWLSLNDFELLE